MPRSKSINSRSRSRSGPVEVLERPTQTTQEEKERPRSGHRSSNEAGEPAERPHRSRHNSHREKRQFRSVEEEAEYNKKKEARRSTRPQGYEMSGGRDGGISLPQYIDGAPPPPSAPEVAEPAAELKQNTLSPLADGVAHEGGHVSSSSADRHAQRRSKHLSVPDPSPRRRHHSDNEKERPVSRRMDSDRPRARHRGEERPRPRRGESDREQSRSPRKRKEENSGFKGLLGGLKKTFV